MKKLKVSWQTYKRPFVRDLAYAIACPSVLTHWVDHNPLLNLPNVTVHEADFWQQQFDAYAPRLLELDNSKEYQYLTQFLMNRPSPHRLGFHFEGLIHFWLIDGFKYGYHALEVLAHNVQLFRDKQTIGELDYILRNHETAEIEHWELAIKFFVGRAPYDFSDWEGLNSRDNLELKMTHMQSRQFNSVYVDVHSKGEMTDTIEKVKVDKRVGVLKGRFFKPITDLKFVRPDWLNCDFPIHDWIGSEDTVHLNCLHIPAVRRAHYIEWFTKRDFYDNHDNIGKLSTASPSWQKDDSLKDYSLKNYPLEDYPLKHHHFKMGLYFERETPFVIYEDNQDDAMTKKIKT